MQANLPSDLILIRHAESQANFETDDFVNRNNVIYDWDHLSKNQAFLSEIKYAVRLVDPNITEEGVKQCQKAYEGLEEYQPDLILVSPLNRTLQTCSKIFPNAKCPIIVEPIFSEGLRSASDYSELIDAKKIAFPHYDFSRVEALGPFWYLTNDSIQNQTKYNEIVLACQGKTYPEILEAIFNFMRKSFIYETPTNLRQRAFKVKQLLKEYRKQYKTIAVVTHYNIIRFVLATEFNEKDEPYHCHIENCQISKRVIEQL